MQIFTFSSRVCTFFVMVLSFCFWRRQTDKKWFHHLKPLDRGTDANFFLPLEISIKFFEFNIVLRRIIYPLFSNICHNTMMAMMDVSMHKQTETNQTQLWYQSPCTSNKQLPITWKKPKWDGILIHFLISHLLLILPSETAARKPVWLLWITIKSIIVGTRLLKGCPQFK